MNSQCIPQLCNFTILNSINHIQIIWYNISKSGMYWHGMAYVNQCASNVCVRPHQTHHNSRTDEWSSQSVVFVCFCGTWVRLIVVFYRITISTSVDRFQFKSGVCTTRNNHLHLFAFWMTIKDATLDRWRANLDLNCKHILYVQRINKTDNYYVRRTSHSQSLESYLCVCVKRGCLME